MIENQVQLRVAVRNLRIFEETLQALHEELEVKNPPLLEVTKGAYERRIASIQKEIVQYLAEHPADVSLVLVPHDLAVAAVTPVLTP